jgi:hypothetical protein
VREAVMKTAIGLFHHATANPAPCRLTEAKIPCHLDALRCSFLFQTVVATKTETKSVMKAAMKGIFHHVESATEHKHMANPGLLIVYA